MAADDQLKLFGTPKVTMRARVRAAPPTDDIVAAAAALDPRIRLGATNWTTSAWDNSVWQQPYPSLTLARDGLSAYAQHPLLRTVLIDRAARVRPTTAALATMAESVPSDFRFVLAADEGLLWGQLPDHRRFGPHAGRANPLFFDASAMAERSVAPFVEGLGERGGLLLIRIPAQNPRGFGTRRWFPERLHGFLSELPRGPRYAVELRDHKLLTAQYASALADVGMTHCLSVHPSMPTLAEQLAIIGPVVCGQADLVVRWSMCVHLDYRAAAQNYAPYDTLVDRDARARASVGGLVADAAARDQRVWVLVDNMAEGCAPATIQEFAMQLTQPHTTA